MVTDLMYCAMWQQGMLTYKQAESLRKERALQ